MADVVELKSTPPPPPEVKPPEAKLEADGNRVSIDSTQKPSDPPKAAPAPSDRPAWLPEQFKSPEEFAEAWKKAQPPPVPPTVKDAETAVSKAGLDMSALQKEFADSGKLSEESLTKLEKAGVTKTQVSEYISGQQAKATLFVQSLETSVGGKEEMAATLQWASGALSPGEIAVANKALQSMDVDQAKVVLSGLHSRRLMETGVEPNLTNGRARGVQGVPGYESTQQWLKDINSPEYKKDPAFRAKVMKRLQASKQ